MKQWALLLLLAAIPLMSRAQPSCYNNFFFRMYDKGRQVKTAKQLSKYKFYDQWGREEVLNGPDAVGYFHAELGAIYPPFIFSIVKGADTMSLYFNEDGRAYRAERLVFKKGYYVVDRLQYEHRLPTDQAAWKAIKSDTAIDMYWCAKPSARSSALPHRRQMFLSLKVSGQFYPLCF